MATDSGDDHGPEWIQARLACEEVFLAFHHFIDQGSATRALGLFTQDGVFEVRGERHRGQDDLSDFLRAREAATQRRTRHLASNFRFTLEAPTRARATANLALFAGTGEDGEILVLEAVTDCEITFVRAPAGTWQMASRRHVRFASAAS